MKVCIHVPKPDFVPEVGQFVVGENGMYIKMDSEVFSDNLFELWKLLKNSGASIYVECYQSGGCWDDKVGHSVVTTLHNGNKPETKVEGHKYNGIHAVYLIPKGYVIECGYWQNKWHGTVDWVYVGLNGFLKYTVATFKATDIDNVVNPVVLSEDYIDIKVEDEELELVESEKLAENPNKLLSAIKVAMEKAACYQCEKEHTW